MRARTIAAACRGLIIAGITAGFQGISSTAAGTRVCDWGVVLRLSFSGGLSALINYQCGGDNRGGFCSEDARAEAEGDGPFLSGGGDFVVSEITFRADEQRDFGGVSGREDISEVVIFRPGPGEEDGVKIAEMPGRVGEGDGGGKVRYSAAM